MGLIKQSQRSYYEDSLVFGGYQFTSLEDIINQFLVAYVGEEKIINKVSRTDVAFHAQRAMQELSFDTFKSIKSQEIVLPPSNTMLLPHDYVNYTKLSWSDSSGIKHPLYPTSETSNPFKIRQDSNKEYDFSTFSTELLLGNSDFADALGAHNFSFSAPKTTKDFNGDAVGDDLVETSGGELIFKNHYDTKTVNNVSEFFSHQYAVWQLLEVDSSVETLSISAKGLSTASATGKSIGTVRVGVTTVKTDVQYTGTEYSLATGYDPGRTHPLLPSKPSFNMKEDVFNLPSDNASGSFVEFSSGNGVLTLGSVNNIDVIDLPLNSNDKKEVYILIVSDNGINSSSVGTTSYTQKVDDISILIDGVANDLTSEESTTWSSYKSNAPSENQDSYDDGYYVNALGQRYGLDTQHAQVNGSFYIDNLKGLINFSSNISGKTVILDYISDSLGTDGEMQVHKFAEEAMYRWILHAIAAGRMQTQQLVPRLKKEKIAAIRQAKLRLSNIKLEELTQILRGKSKHIKH